MDSQKPIINLRDIEDDFYVRELSPDITWISLDNPDRLELAHNFTWFSARFYILYFFVLYGLRLRVANTIIVSPPSNPKTEGMR